MNGDPLNQWTTNTRTIVVSLIVVLLGIFVYLVRTLIGPMIVAFLVAYSLHPLVVRLKNRTGMRHGPAVALVFFPTLIALFATPGTFVPLLTRQIRTLVDEVLNVLALIESRLAQPVIILGRTLSQEELVDFVNAFAASFTPAADDAIQVIEATSTSLVWLLVILVTVYYLLLDGHGLRHWFLNIFPASQWEELDRLLHEIDLTWRSYLRGTLALMFMMGVFFTIAGLAIGLPGAVALGLLTGVLSIIPEIGPTIAAITSGLVAFFEGSNFLPLSNFWFAILVVALYLVVMQIKSLWLRPMVMGRFMHMNTGLVFVAIIGAALVSGVLAALIILPVIATAGHLGRYVRAKILGLDPWPQPVKPPVEPETDAPTPRSEPDVTDPLPAD